MRLWLLWGILSLGAPVWADSFWSRFCGGLLRPGYEPRLVQLADEITIQIVRLVQSGRFETRVGKVRELEGSPSSVAVEPLGSIGASLIVLPHAIHWDWNEHSRDLRNGDALVGIVDDLYVTRSDGQRIHITDILATEFMRIQHHNPSLKMNLKWMKAYDYKVAKFHARQADRLVFWVEGDLKNFQMKRTMLLLMEHALRAMDSFKEGTGSAW